ncbi:MAG: Ig-like domain-containing protein, partial [Clostridia bacterium]|nr:Ig-like domain-containing protein [Clostridia bacterium]
GITITELGSAYVSLMWEPSKNADSYLLLIRPKGTSVWTSKVTTHNAFTFSGLASETAYEIIIYASNDGVLSEKSNTVTIVTEAWIEKPTEAPSEEEDTTEAPSEEDTTFWPWWEEETTTEPTTQPYFSVSVNNSYSCYVNESIKIEPVFTPSNTPDKSFTLEGKDYTYSYKAGLFGSQTKTDTCKFEDYFFIDNKNGRLLAKQATVEPKTGNAFSFTVTLTAANGKTTTFKVSAIAKLISIYYAGEDSPWYYGNSAKLSADIDSSAGFSADSLVWSSSNTKVATVSSDGMVKCVGTGEVTITATAPVGTKSHSITFFVNEIIVLSKDYLENCVVGKSYKLDAYTKPSGNTDNILYLSSDPDIASVDNNGIVTFKKNGFVRIHLSAPNAIDTIAVMTTDTCTLPSGTKAELLSILENSANKIKTQMPALYHSSLPTFTNVKIHKEGNFKTEDLVGIFESFASSQSRYIPAVTFKNYPNQTEYDNAYSSYMASVPVSGAHYLVIPGLQESEIKSIEVVDKGSYTYDIKLTLNDEYMAAPPSRASDTAHGKMFDILTNDYLVKIKAGLENSGSGMSMKYSAFRQTYNNSTFTVSYNKVTGKITNLNYDMNVHVEIMDLKLSMTLITAIDSTVTFDVNNVVNYEVK